MPYLLTTGHDETLDAADALVPQPRTIGLQYTRRLYPLSGNLIDEAPFVEFLYSMIESITQYQAILTQYGLLTAKTALVSVQIQDENYDDAVFNGVAVKPQIGVDGQREDYFLRNFTLLVHSLRAQA